MADAQLPAKPKRIPGLPNNFQLLTFDGFDGLNTKPTRAGLKDQQCFVLDNFMPLGKSNVRTLYDVGGAIAHIDSTGQIQPGPVPVPPVTGSILGVHFDGATLVTNPALVAPNTSQLSFSQWLLTDAPLNFSSWVVDPTGQGNDDFLGGDQSYEFGVTDPTFASFFQIGGPGLVAGNWHNILCSIDVGFAPGSRLANLYLDDVNILNINNDNGVAFVMAFNALALVIGTGVANYVGDMAELWAMPGQFIDFSVTANRRKFLSASGGPVDLGTDGSTPTGTAPPIYLSRRTGDTTSAFATNRGTGGAFTVTAGTLTASATDPHL